MLIKLFSKVKNLHQAFREDVDIQSWYRSKIVWKFNIWGEHQSSRAEFKFDGDNTIKYFFHPISIIIILC